MNTTLSAAPPQGGHSSRLPDLVLIGITMIWGFTFLTVQHALQWAGPLTFVALRFGAAALIAALYGWRQLAGLTRRELLTGALVGCVLFGSYSLQTIGLQYIPSSKSAFLTGLYVPLVPLIQLLLFRRHPKLAAWLGIAVAFVGLTLLSDPRGMTLTLGKGEWLTIAGAAAIALEISLISRFANGVEARRVAVVQLFTVSLLAGLGSQLSGEAAPQWNPVLLISLLGLGLATALIQIAMNWAQKTVPATRATIIYAMEPVWAGLVGALAGENLSAMAITGAALIVASVLISELGGASD
ncbi:DMT family transporter [uncultured Aquitalea sp.]|uniref:DMT family transporter n=1 Tax=uncultured Aquitalea sp. TaxID=540272 RepID=UPI0025F366B8|nr:DMT family transporter [uncultured Aquitalea sp.]